MTGDDQAALAKFSGSVRLFPLPNLVLFPHVVQGLHVFEPRYRQLMADTLAGDRLFAVALLRPGWEDEYDERPAVEPVCCLGRVSWHEKLSDGRYNLRLKALSRARISEEVPTDRLYRTARASLIADVSPADTSLLSQLRKRLADAVLPRFAPEGPAAEQLRELFRGEMPLGHVTDVLSYALPLPLELKQALLCEAHVERRAEVLMHALALSAARADRKFPPEFSAN
jgi:Lon protease-like protein